MILDAAQGMALLVLSFIATFVLLAILIVVHKQAARVKELELRMKAMESVESSTVAAAKGEIK